MTSADSYAATLDEIERLARQIGLLVDELRPITARIQSGDHDRSILQKNTLLQDRIAALDQQRERLRALVS